MVNLEHFAVQGDLYFVLELKQLSFECLVAPLEPVVRFQLVRRQTQKGESLIIEGELVEGGPRYFIVERHVECGLLELLARGLHDYLDGGRQFQLGAHLEAVLVLLGRLLLLVFFFLDGGETLTFDVFRLLTVVHKVNNPLV